MIYMRIQVSNFKLYSYGEYFWLQTVVEFRISILQPHLNSLILHRLMHSKFLGDSDLVCGIFKDELITFWIQGKFLPRKVTPSVFGQVNFVTINCWKLSFPVNFRIFQVFSKTKLNFVSEISTTKCDAICVSIAKLLAQVRLEVTVSCNFRKLF